MPLIHRWLEYLNQMQVRYSHSVHPRAETARATAEAEKMPVHEFAKTVVYFSERGYGLAVVPADEFMDMNKLAGLLKIEFVRLATEAELAELFPDCELGAMPPFGDICEMPVTVDAAIAGEFIAFTLGTHRDVIRMSFADFQRLAKPVVGLIAMERGVLV
ncbi:MAG: YbaK/EbsC family protein [Bryobacteraceae bacterium]|jgi:Ala-tRNA(Pro) deacylase